MVRKRRTPPEAAGRCEAESSALSEPDPQKMERKFMYLTAYSAAACATGSWPSGSATQFTAPTMHAHDKMSAHSSP